MGREPSAAFLAMRAAADARVQSWTRCRIPIEKVSPYSLTSQEEKHVAEWPGLLAHLLPAPGFREILAGRNIDDEEEVLIICDWVDIASLNAFIASPDYAAYFDALSISDPTSLYAYFIIQPSIESLWTSCKVTTLTYTFDHPATQQNRDDFALVPAFPTSHRARPQIHRAWLSKPQVLASGKLVDIAMLLQRWPHEPILQQDPQREMSSNPRERGPWEREIDEMNLVVEEVTWLFRWLDRDVIKKDYDQNHEDEDEEEDEGEE